MSEVLGECDVHQHEDGAFRSAVLKALIARTVLNGLSPLGSKLASAPTEFIGALGIDAAWSERVNNCATSIADGTCRKYVFDVTGRGVIVQPRSSNE